MTTTPATHGGRRPGAGRKPTDPATHKSRVTVTLSPEVRAFLADYARVDPQRGVSGAVERLIRISRRFKYWQDQQP